MKALTVYQPHAQLIASGAKEYETRNWSHPYRGELAIHAARMWTFIEKHSAQQPPVPTLLAAAGFPDPESLPHGAIIAIVELVAIYDAWQLAPKISAQERQIGHYAPGRFAWRMKVKYRLPKPIPVHGDKGLWDWDPQEYLRSLEQR